MHITKLQYGVCNCHLQKVTLNDGKYHNHKILIQFYYLGSQLEGKYPTLYKTFLIRKKLVYLIAEFIYAWLLMTCVLQSNHKIKPQELPRTSPKKKKRSHATDPRGESNRDDLISKS